MPTVFADQVRNLKKGEFAGPIRTPAGYHVLALLDRRGAEQMVVHEHALVKVREDMPLDLAALIGWAARSGRSACRWMCVPRYTRRLTRPRPPTAAF